VEILTMLIFAPPRSRCRSGKAALIAVAVVVAALFIAGGIIYVNRPREAPKAAEGPRLSPAEEAKRQQDGEASLGVKGNPGQPGAPVERMPDGRPLPQ
jgi:hypothetical protein